MTGIRPAHSGHQEARYDSEIVAMFGDPAEGWELLCTLPSDVLAEVRARRQQGELDELAITELRHRYRHLLASRTGRRPPKTR